MARVVHYCVMAYRRYQVFPVLLVFAPEHVSIPTEICAYQMLMVLYHLAVNIGPEKDI
jgi:hypothetical protein